MTNLTTTKKLNSIEAIATALMSGVMMMDERLVEDARFAFNEMAKTNEMEGTDMHFRAECLFDCIDTVMEFNTPRRVRHRTVETKALTH